MEIPELIVKMERARKRLNAAIEKATPQAEIYPTWKIKQVMDHITGWDVLVAASLRKYAVGELPNVTVKEGMDAFNALSVSERRELSLEQSRQAYAEAREEVIEILNALPPDVLEKVYPAPWGGECTIDSVVKIFVYHELEHAKQIEKSLK